MSHHRRGAILHRFFRHFHAGAILMATVMAILTCACKRNPGIVYLDRERFPIAGIDISAHNGDIDFAKVKNDGVDFVFIKATEGATFKDRRFFDNYRLAREAGLKVGAYHFFRFDTPGYMQGLNFLNSVDRRKLDLPIAIDLEEWTNPANHSTALVISRLKEMIDHLENHGYKVMIYTNKNGYNRFVKGHFDSYPLWICSLVDEPTDIPWTLWQSTHNGTVDGIAHPVDINAFTGSVEEWGKWTATDIQ